MPAEVILLAGGASSRMAATVDDKILVPLAGKSAFRRGIEAFLEAKIGRRFIVVFRHAAQRDALAAECAEMGVEPIFVQGGEQRQDSVRNGLRATTPGSGLVFIHDCARALIHPESLSLVAAAAERDGAAVLAHPVTDTIKRIPSPGRLGNVPLEDLDRRHLWAMETPQVFRRDWIACAYARLDGTATDDTAVAVAAGHGVTIVPNPHPNPKLTHPRDLDYFTYLLDRHWRPLQQS